MLNWRVDHNKRLSNFVCKNHDCQKGDQCGTILEVCQMICFSVFLQGCRKKNREINTSIEGFMVVVLRFRCHNKEPPLRGQTAPGIFNVDQSGGSSLKMYGYELAEQTSPLMFCGT